jgi:tripartite-type tricarboxylate transporter receptor subunit TctC
MRKMKRLEGIFAISVALLATLGSIRCAAAQIYPSRPITMIVPYPAGSRACWPNPSGGCFLKRW